MAKQEVLSKLREALLTYDAQKTETVAREALEEGVDPLEAISRLTQTAREIGDRYGRYEIFLADLIGASEALMAGMKVLGSRMTGGEAPTIGKVVIGTVKGDIHEIGKNIVATMLTASGFQVNDIGYDVAHTAFAEAAERSGAQIIAASALMSTTMPMLNDIVDYLKATGVREKYKVMIGGGPVTNEYATEIEADGYAPDASGASKLAQDLVTRR